MFTGLGCVISAEEAALPNDVKAALFDAGIPLNSITFLDGNPHPEPDLSEVQLRDWGVFSLFLQSESNMDAESAGSHIDWILRRDFKTPEEWLGDGGVKFRKAQAMREHDPGVHKAWADFQIQKAETHDNRNSQDLK
jgi:hypothetical protein